MRKGLVGLVAGLTLTVATSAIADPGRISSDFQAPYAGRAFPPEYIEVTTDPKQDTISEAVAAYLHQHGMCVSNRLLYEKKINGQRNGIVGSTLLRNGIDNDRIVMQGEYEIDVNDIYELMNKPFFHWKVLVFDKNGWP